MWHSYLPITLTSQGFKLVWINIDTSGPSMKQHDFKPTGDVMAKRNWGYNLPITWHNQPFIPHRKVQKMEIVLCLDVHWWYLWKPFLLISTETDDDSSNCLRRTQWFSSAKIIALGCIGERKKQMLLIRTVLIHDWFLNFEAVILSFTYTNWV